MDANGKIGIGTSSPNQSVDITINGTTNFTTPNPYGGYNTVRLSTQDENFADLSPASIGEGTLGFAENWYEIYADYGYIYMINTEDIYATYIYGTYITQSDRKLKKNIKTLGAEQNLLELLKPVTYEYIETTKTGKKGREMKLAQGLQSGFIAQDVQEVFPHLVSEIDSAGTLGINMIGIIPYLVEAYQEQQKQIDALQSLLTSQSTLKSASMDNIDDMPAEIVSTSTLAQNIPNPFTQNTSIGYSLNSDVKSAQLLLFDMNGKLLQTYPLALGSDKLQIEGSSLQPGMYIYTLVCDGAEIDTKRMILTK